MTNLVAVTDKNSWNNAIDRHPEANFLQAWQYGAVQQGLGHRVLRYQLMDGESIRGNMQLIIKNAKRGRFIEIPGGPLIDWQNTALLRDTLRHLVRIGEQNHCVFVRFRAQISDSETIRSRLLDYALRPSPMHVTADHTSIIDLTKSSDELLANMRQQTRYEVKRAAKRDIIITSSRTPEVIETLHSVQLDTARRQNFIPPSQKYLQLLVREFGKQATIYQAKRDDILLNTALVINYGAECDYLEAASTIDARREPGAYAIIWQAIQDAQSAGIARLNLWGTAPPDTPQHRYAGVTTFKHGFGGDNIAYLPPHDIVIQPLRYKINYLIETVRKKRRHL